MHVTKPQHSVGDLINRFNQQPPSTSPPQPLSNIQGAPKGTVSSTVQQLESTSQPKPIVAPSGPQRPTHAVLQDSDVFTKDGRSYYSAYKDVSTFRLKQSTYLSNKDPSVREGVCRAASLHWIDRGFRGKESFSSSKHGAVAKHHTQAPWTARMDDKVTKKWIPVQKVQDPHANAATFNLALGTNTAVITAPLVENLSKTGLFVKGQGGEVLHDPQIMAERICGSVGPNKSYLMTLKGTPLKKGGDAPCHIVALRTGPERQDALGVPKSLQIFDPNIGEFTFDLTTEKGAGRLESFLKDWTQSDLSRSNRPKNMVYGLGVQSMYLTEVTRA